MRNQRTNRIDVKVIRYHQGSWATGTITAGGVTHDLGEGAAFGFRDHSWGVRQGVGTAPGDLIGAAPAIHRGAGAPRGQMKWNPSFFRRPDGSYHETAIFTAESDRPVRFS